MLGDASYVVIVKYGGKREYFAEINDIVMEYMYDRYRWG